MKIDVDRREKENGYLFLKVVLIILFIFSSIEPNCYGNSFVNPYLFSVLLFIGVTSQLLTRYYYYKYYKKIKDLILILFFILIVKIKNP